jgi:DNA repair exonuclease SbcCD nuclease subunit
MAIEFVRVAQEEKPDAIVILGDTLHEHERSYQPPFDLACKTILELSEIAPVILLIGNHDYVSNSEFLNDKHHFNPLKNIPNITVVDDVLSQKIGDYEFLFAPYVYVGRFFEALLKRFKIKEIIKMRAIFGHQEMEGASMGGKLVKEGEKWPDDFPLAVMGHDHEFQIVQDNLIYTGTPIQHNFGDGTDKGIYLFTFTDDQFDMQKIKLLVPMKKIYRIGYDEVANFELEENVETKIKVLCTAEEYRKLDKDGHLERLKEQGVVVTHEDPNSKSEHNFINTNKPFVEMLYDNIKDDQNLLSLYEDIFHFKPAPPKKKKLRIAIRK